MKTIHGVAVIDKATKRIVALHTATTPFHAPKFPNLYTVYHGDIQVDDAADLNELNCIQFKFDTTTMVAVETPGDSDSIMEKLALTNRKFAVHTILTGKIVAARRNAGKSLYGQAEIYKMKESQARNFRKSGYVNPNQYPMVKQYAELLNKSPKQAADAILRKARDKNAVLANTENARLIFKRSIFNANSFDQLGQVADNINTVSF
jgi:hypothetical protein